MMTFNVACVRLELASSCLLLNARQIPTHRMVHCWNYNAIGPAPPGTATVHIGVDLTGILGGTHGRSHYKSPAAEAKKTHFPTL